MQTNKIGVVMDAIETIHFHKDTTFALLLEAQRRGKQIYYMQPHQLFVHNEIVHAQAHVITVNDQTDKWITFVKDETLRLTALDMVFMRKDPPVDMDYINTTHILELAEKQGLLVVNRPHALRDVNEKLFTRWFPACTPPTLVSSHLPSLRAFIQQQDTAVIKPLNSMGGSGIFRLSKKDVNLASALEVLTDKGRHLIMAQRFIPEIREGDKRIILINGHPIPYALARIPAKGEFRGNLVAGARGEGRPLTDHDRWICEQVGPTIREKGLFLVGLDVIGDYLTEINVTSPTGIRELEAAFNINICGQLFDALEKNLQ